MQGRTTPAVLPELVDLLGNGADDHGVPSGTSMLIEPGFATDVLDALPDATAILDPTGSIVAVNRAWRMFALDNGGRPEATGVGVNYLDVCVRAAETGCADAEEVFTGLQAVLSGETVESDREYPCPSPTVGRWFNSRITPTRGCLLYTSPSPRDRTRSRMPSSA